MRAKARPLVSGLIAALTLEVAACGKQNDVALVPECPGQIQYSETDRLRSMLVVQALVIAWDKPRADHNETLPEPSPGDVARAVEVLRCDFGALADSRRRRAVAKLLGHDWKGERSTPLLLGLGFSDVSAIDELKRRVVAEFSEAAFELHAHDTGWLEYAVLHHLTTSGGGPLTGSHSHRGVVPARLSRTAVVYAEVPPSCWRPESESTFAFINPYLEMTAHVSVDLDAVSVGQNVDAQRWNDCGPFWSPPDPSNPAVNLDGAYFTPKTWLSTPCTKPQPPFPPDASAPQAGTTYDIHYLFEQFFSPLGTSIAWFDNILAIWVSSTTTIGVNGTVLQAQQLDYRLGSCGNDMVDGAIGGGIGNSDMTTVLDSGWILVWPEGGRIHVSALKRAQLSSSGTNWLTQLNPALRELNDELGELACCLR